MSDGNAEPLAYLGETTGHVRRAPVPGRSALVTAALAIGILFLGLQLWLLTVALDLYLGGSGDTVWGIALCSGGVFLGGLLVVRVLGRRPRRQAAVRGGRR